MSAAAADFRTALGLWRGEPLADVPSQLLRAREVPYLKEQLPVAARHFAGRTAELAVLSGLVQETATPGGTVVISAIDGTAGIGKTALAVHFAHQVAGRFPGGQLYVNLRGFGPFISPVQPAAAIRGFLDAFGVDPHRIAADAEAIDCYERALEIYRRVGDVSAPAKSGTN